MAKQISDQGEPVLKFSSKDGRYYFHAAIVILFMLCFRFIPPFGGLTEMGVTIMGIFIGLLYGYATIGMIWPSLFGLLAFGTSGYTTVKAAFASGFGNDTTILVFLLFVFCSLVTSAKIGEVFSLWFLRRKSAVGHPWMLSFYILLGTFIVQPFTTLYPAILMMWSIFYSIALRFGFQKGDKYPAYMIVGIVFAAVISNETLPWNPLAVLIFGNMSKLAGIDISFFVYFALVAPLAIISLILYVCAGKIWIKPDLAQLQNYNQAYIDSLEKQSLTTYQKLILGLFALMVVLIFLPSILPKTIPLVAFIASVGTTGLIAFSLALAALITFQGKSLVDFKRLVNQSVNWEIIIMFTAVLPIGASFGSEETGISAFIVNMLNPVLGGLGPVAFCVLAIVIASCITQVCNNMVSSIVLIPILYNFSVQLGINAAILAVMLVPALSMALVTPAGAGSSALMHANTEWLGKGYSYKFALLVFAINMVVMLGIGLPVVSLVLR